MKSLGDMYGRQTDMLLRKRVVTDNETGNLDISENMKNYYSKNYCYVTNHPNLRSIKQHAFFMLP